jgi:rhamnose utilization protein RhaD (predicted bifunctional aldolase and dehydrogenase)/NAD(P)-dependent dehydrogenase (short-subunit alcohol dehydrogenase family)
MKSLWTDAEAAGFGGALGQRVYTSRLLGRDRSLVLHGGGNTSVKLRETDILGREFDVLYVKGSGWDLEHIEAAGFAPVRLQHLQDLARLNELSDTQMVNEMATQRVQAAAPAPSVEAILHAILPYRFVDHTHADAVIAVCNTADGAARIRDIYGESVVVIPYVMPGFELARLCAERFPAQPGPALIGMVLLNHGIFSFGDTARESYERMIRLVGMAEEYLQRRGAWDLQRPVADALPGPAPADLAALRKEVCTACGFPLIMTRRAGEAARSFAARADLAGISQQGPATPDHVIRTKRLPMLGRDVAGYVQAYAAYFAAGQASAPLPRTMLDPAPRVVLEAALGMCALGRSAADASACAEIYEHTMQIILRSEALGGYRALPARAIFDVEYWDLEQAKLQRAGKAPPFAGEVALVTGAASGIGKACVRSLLARGAAVVGLDLNPAVTALHRRQDYLGLECDLVSEAALRAALVQAVDAYGGLDMLVLNAGIFPGGCRIEALATADWRRVMQVNLDANLALLREAHPLLKLAPRNGRVVVIGSKNVPAPGPGAAAYSAAKAALSQLARVAALEWGADGIRINTLHPNAVFDTGIWTPEVLAARAAHYGLTVDAYKRNNVLGVEVSSSDVAELAAELCGPVFSRTTGAQIPVDGGNDRVI